MDLHKVRKSSKEQQRIADLLAMMPAGRLVLDVGARDGYISCLLTSSFEHVVALDLERPQIGHERVTAVAGDVTCLRFPDNSFDTVLCAEVLEHIPSPLLRKACDEIARVARQHVLIGVPYMQDIRVGRTKCCLCAKANPPWGHVNVFDENRLRGLFPRLALERVSFVGKKKSRTNCLSAFLMDLAGNPFGVYDQEERCIFCGAKLEPPAEIGLPQRVLARAAFLIRRVHEPFTSPHPNWLHALFVKHGLAPDDKSRVA